MGITVPLGRLFDCRWWTESTLTIGHQAIDLIRTECVDLSAPPTFYLDDAVRQ